MYHGIISIKKETKKKLSINTCTVHTCILHVLCYIGLLLASIALIS